MLRGRPMAARSLSSVANKSCSGREALSGTSVSTRAYEFCLASARAAL
jgi:hypothetical protein